MKILALFLTLLTLSLSSNPCCVPTFSSNAASTTISSTPSCCDSHQDETSESEDEHDDKCDNCSPFYTCGMGGGCTLTNFETFSILSAYFDNQYSNLNASKFDSEYHQAMWQPPKFV